MSIFMMVMIGGGIIFIDDKARGLHEGYLVTPITKLRADRRVQRVGHDQGGAGGYVSHDHRIGDRRHPQCVRTASSLPAVRGHRRDRIRALISMMFLIMVRVTIRCCRGRFSACSTRCSISRAGPCIRSRDFAWMQVIAVADPFTYSVHAFKNLLLKDTGFEAIASDLGFLFVFSSSP
jgi:ABC-2 type transport system permease protein